MKFVAAVGTPCDVPDDFDQDSYYHVGKSLAQYSEVPAFSSYASGFNAVAFRFAAMQRSVDRFTVAMSAQDALTPGGPRLEQEDSLFAFFVNAVSVLECFYFALYNLGACIGPALFAVSTSAELRRISVPYVVDGFEKAFPGDEFSRKLREVATSQELRELKEYRDFLTHRGTSPRKHKVTLPRGSHVDLTRIESATIVSNPKDAPAGWLSDLQLSAELTTTPREWVGVSVRELLRGAADFVDRHAPAV